MKRTSHRASRGRTIAAACLAVATALVAAAGPATSDSASAPGEGFARKVKFGKLTVDNSLGSVVVVQRIRGMRHIDKGAVDLELDTGYRDWGNFLYPDWNDSGLVVTAFRGSRARLGKYSGVEAEYRRVRCPDLDVAWQMRKRRLRFEIPQTCLGDDTGMLRARTGWYFQDGPAAWAETRPVQLGPRGAAYDDVDGDGAADRITQRSADGGSAYQVRVVTTTETLTATAPRNDDFDWQGAEALSGLDINRDGHAEVIGDPADNAGDGAGFHLFTVVDDELVLVRTTDGEPFVLLTAGVGSREYYGFRCAAGGLQTWESIGGGTDAGDRYRLRLTNWTFDTGTAVPTSTEKARLSATTVVGGNHSPGSCIV
ncbi:hypothetical protein [Nocardioides ferulae]|uniref:hypothetical protein n=1 Tax=Nocardioides ferulae TaxID=2340821 RepID=UPI000F875F8F|nr:hypothetical protein [Nocardioides ferulae]